MLKDITIGQYFPGESPVHKMDPRAKILLTLFYIVMLYTASNMVSLMVAVAYALMAFVISKTPINLILKSIKPVVPVVVFTAVINMFFIEGTTVYLDLHIIKITKEGLIMAAVMAIRIFSLIVGSSLLTYTTSPIALTDGIEKLLSPLKVVGISSHEIAMMMTIALRFIPTLIEETDKIISAQKARGANMDEGNFVQRAKAMIPILIPLFVSSFRRAEDLALAMECRCYHGGEGRTRLREIEVTVVDYAAVAVTAVFMGAILFANGIFPSVNVFI